MRLLPGNRNPTTYLVIHPSGSRPWTNIAVRSEFDAEREKERARERGRKGSREAWRERERERRRRVSKEDPFSTPPIIFINTCFYGRNARFARQISFKMLRHYESIIMYSESLIIICSENIGTVGTF